MRSHGTPMVAVTMLCIAAACSTAATPAPDSASTTASIAATASPRTSALPAPSVAASPTSQPTAAPTASVAASTAPAPTAAPVAPTQNPTPVAVATPQPPLVVSGRAFVAASGAGAAGVSVSIFAGSPCCFTVAHGTTDSSGAYVIVVGAGTYLVSFEPPSGSYAPQYWKAARSPADATKVVVGTSSLSGIDAALVPGFAVNGTVTNGSGAAVASAWVTVSDTASGGGHVASTRTDASGHYDLRLLNGTYQLNFYPPTNNCCSGPGAFVANIVVSGQDQTVNGRLP